MSRGLWGTRRPLSAGQTHGNDRPPLVEGWMWKRVELKTARGLEGARITERIPVYTACNACLVEGTRHLSAQKPHLTTIDTHHGQPAIKPTIASSCYSSSRDNSQASYITSLLHLTPLCLLERSTPGVVRWLLSTEKKLARNDASSSHPHNSCWCCCTRPRQGNRGENIKHALLHANHRVLRSAKSDWGMTKEKWQLNHCTVKEEH